MAARRYVTNAIPFVNGDPHVGHALEFVHADAIARWYRLRGDDVRYLSGTDDHASKNVAAAAAAGRPVRDFVDDKAARFAALRAPLELSYDSFIRTSVDARHRCGVAALWRACSANDDLYLRDYRGLYCSGCEAYLGPGDLVGGRCPEHDRAPEEIAERNWFFRLSRYGPALEAAITAGRLRIEPVQRRNEVLAFIRAGLDDLSVSRSAARAGGWGIPVPDDPTQTVYVWFDALANYVSDLGFGGDGAAHERWWRAADARTHVVGKGIVRFHAVHWPAILLSAGEPLPTRILVHDYLTVDGAKIGKSRGNGADPLALARRYGTDALRWWLLHGVARVGDSDFSAQALHASAAALANGLGNLVSRIVRLAADAPPDAIPASGEPTGCEALLRALAALPAVVDDAVERYDLRGAATAWWHLVDVANRVVAATRPWELARAARAGDATAAARLAALLADLVAACRALGALGAAFLPGASARIAAALDGLDPALARRILPRPPRDG
jgi:methionyl-tRNA synthetase